MLPTHAHASPTTRRVLPTHAYASPTPCRVVVLCVGPPPLVACWFFGGLASPSASPSLECPSKTVLRRAVTALQTVVYRRARNLNTHTHPAPWPAPCLGKLSAHTPRSAGPASGKVKWKSLLNIFFWNLNYYDSASAFAGDVQHPGGGVSPSFAAVPQKPPRASPQHRQP